VLTIDGDHFPASGDSTMAKLALVKGLLSNLAVSIDGSDRVLMPYGTIVGNTSDELRLEHLWSPADPAPVAWKELRASNASNPFAHESGSLIILRIPDYSTVLCGFEAREDDVVARFELDDHERRILNGSVRTWLKFGGDDVQKWQVVLIPKSYNPENDLPILSGDANVIPSDWVRVDPKDQRED
jgi:hypothetical protein